MMQRRVLLMLSVCGCVVAGCATIDSSPNPDESSAAKTPTGAEAFHGLIQYRAKDAKPAILDPLLLPAHEAVIAPGTKVIGVFIGGEARAYPLFILNNHQIVNDQVGGVPISASW